MIYRRSVELKLESEEMDSSRSSGVEQKEYKPNFGHCHATVFEENLPLFFLFWSKFAIFSDGFGIRTDRFTLRLSPPIGEEDSKFG